MKNIVIKIRVIVLFLLVAQCLTAQKSAVREQINIDRDWRFAFGHPYDTAKDFNHNTAYFSYLSKTGYGDGPAAEKFDDRPWRLLNLPHDWAVEQDFAPDASFSHGFKAAGKGYADKSIGWYRKVIAIPNEDLGKIISLKFDGVFRNSKVWFNGHYLGTEESGYSGFEYDVTAYVNYGGKNTISVRVDAGMEEGWFYEGAGIYRHVYLVKTNPLHLADNSTAITTRINGSSANISAEVALMNKGAYTGSAEIIQTIKDPQGKEVAVSSQKVQAPGFYDTSVVKSELTVTQPKLWSVDTPDLYKLVTQIKTNGQLIDSHEIIFGIRSIRFDAEKGFFLNGKPLKLKGTNNHQDHAGVGTALPDELQYFRIKKLKEMGANAYRCSHHPPTPQLLEACDRLGMLVIDETRLMGINDYHLGQLKRMILRDRNHPSIISWSVGNEEWMIEGNIKGERITNIMQGYVKSLDTTRTVTVGISSGFKSGISSVVEVMGYNYLGNGDIDAHRNAFNTQPGMGTEEGSTFATRGVYFTDNAKHYQSAYDRKPRQSFYSIEEGWTFYDARPYLAGMFIWTGFDYRGEPTPYGYPSVTSYFGMMDVCGFPKDNVYYLKSWWGNEPVLHIMPHWNWPGMEGKEIDVWVYSNCETVELFLNKKSLGTKKMSKNSHLEWKVPYSPGTLEALGYNNGKKVLVQQQKTTGEARNIKLTAHKNTLSRGIGDLGIITVEVTDKNGLHVPFADDEITFSISGGGKIIGVGNGNPTSLEKDMFLDDIKNIPLINLKEQSLETADLPLQVPVLNTLKWKPAFENRDYKNQAPAYVYTTDFTVDALAKDNIVTFYYQKLGMNARVFVNGKSVTPTPDDSEKYVLDNALLQQGKNTLHIVANPVKKVNDWDVVNTNPGVIQVVTPSEPARRKLFNGFAQLIVQEDGSGTEILVHANALHLKNADLKITVKP